MAKYWGQDKLSIYKKTTGTFGAADKAIFSD